jgi:hypothetical protein
VAEFRNYKKFGGPLVATENTTRVGNRSQTFIYQSIPYEPLRDSLFELPDSVGSERVHSQSDRETTVTNKHGVPTVCRIHPGSTDDWAKNHCRKDGIPLRFRASLCAIRKPHLVLRWIVIFLCAETLWF